MTTAPQYITDADGRRVGVVLNIADYEALRDAEEELAALRARNAPKRTDSEHLPLERFLFELQG